MYFLVAELAKCRTTLRCWLKLTLIDSRLGHTHTHTIISRTIHVELNLMNHSNLWISRAMDLTEGGCNLIFALGFKTRPRKTRDGNRTIAFMIPLCREALSVQFRPTVSN